MTLLMWPWWVMIPKEDLTGVILVTWLMLLWWVRISCLLLKVRDVITWENFCFFYNGYKPGGGGSNLVIKKFVPLLICSVGCLKTARKTTENRREPLKTARNTTESGTNLYKNGAKRGRGGSKAFYNPYKKQTFSHVMASLRKIFKKWIKNSGKSYILISINSLLLYSQPNVQIITFVMRFPRMLVSACSSQSEVEKIVSLKLYFFHFYLNFTLHSSYKRIICSCRYSQQNPHCALVLHYWIHILLQEGFLDLPGSI